MHNCVLAIGDFPEKGSPPTPVEGPLPVKDLALQCFTRNPEQMLYTARCQQIAPQPDAARPANSTSSISHN